MYSILWCSIDSFLAALAIGLVDRRRARPYGLIAAFSLCDGVSYAMGHGIRFSPVANVFGDGSLSTLALSAAAAFAVLIVLFARSKPAIVWCLPILLGLDNFISGVLGVSETPIEAVVVGIALSGLLAYAGFGVARNLGSALSRSVAIAAALMLALSSLILV